MKTIELNIGLNNNPLDVVDINVLISDALSLKIIDFSLNGGQYKGQPEQTLVILAKTNLTPDEVNSTVRLLAHQLNQESIAYTLDGRGELVYALGRALGEREEFNYNFFQTLQTFGKGTRTGAIRNTGARLNK